MTQVPGIEILSVGNDISRGSVFCAWEELLHLERLIGSDPGRELGEEKHGQPQTSSGSARGLSLDELANV